MKPNALSGVSAGPIASVAAITDGSTSMIGRNCFLTLRGTRMARVLLKKSPNGRPACLCGSGQINRSDLPSAHDLKKQQGVVGKILDELVLLCVRIEVDPPANGDVG